MCWLPVREPDLTAGPVLFTEPKLLMVAAAHPLARRGFVALEDLAHLQVCSPAVPVPEYWEEAFHPFRTPSRAPIARGAAIRDWEDILGYVSTGEIVHVIGAHAARYNPRPDISYLPFEEDTAFRWGLVWRTESRSPAIDALASVARELGTREM